MKILMLNIKAVTKVMSLVLLLLTVGYNLNVAQAQDTQSQLDRMRVAFITNELNLSKAEAEEFFPVYHEYRVEKRQLNEPASRSLGEIETKEKELILLKKYINKFSEIISKDKAALVEKVDKDFSIFILTHIQEKKN